MYAKIIAATILVMSAVVILYYGRRAPVSTPSATKELLPLATAKDRPIVPSRNILETSEREKAETQWKVYSEIAESKNDNDPRLDNELRDLSETARDRFRQGYRRLPAEDRNERGTLVFLLGRELKSNRDVNFLKEVLAEPACKSLGRCESAGDLTKHAHIDPTVPLTLAYPQLVALSVIEKHLKSSSAPFQSDLLTLLTDATRAQDPIVAKKAEKLLLSSRSR